MQSDPSDCQSPVLAFVREFISNKGCSPLYDEIGENIGIKRNTVHGHIDSLVSKGLLLREPRKRRGLRLPEPVVSSDLPSFDLWTIDLGAKREFRSNPSRPVRVDPNIFQFGAGRDYFLVRIGQTEKTALNLSRGSVLFVREVGKRLKNVHRRWSLITMDGAVRVRKITIPTGSYGPDQKIRLEIYRALPKNDEHLWEPRKRVVVLGFIEGIFAPGIGIELGDFPRRQERRDTKVPNKLAAKL